jgi:glycosyltransferase involved in cell wall biosynthesis
MRILLIHQVFASPDLPGSTRHYEFARHCVGAGHAFTVVASDLAYKTGERVAKHKGLFAREEQDGVQILRTYTYPSLHRSFAWRVFAFVSFMITSVITALRAGKVDLVMGTSPPIFQAVSAWLVAVLRRRPFLLEIRDLWPEFGIEMGVLTNPLLIAMSRWLERFLYARATHLMVNSPAYVDYLIGKGIPAQKITLVPNGVDPAMFDPLARGEALRQEFGLEGKFVAIYAGALGLANDIPTILRAADRLRQHPNLHILLVGDGKERPKLEAMASQMHLTNLTFVGPRPKAEMPDVLAAADACLATLQDIPMFRTTYPNKVFDYMAAGRPTVLAIDGVIRQVLDDARGGVFVPPGDDGKMAEALVRLSENREQARRMGIQARAHVVRHFCRADQADKFVGLLEEMARHAGQGRSNPAR